jgi:hypothetical protein
MKSVLDLILDRLGTMSAEEVIEATKYKSEDNVCTH